MYPQHIYYLQTDVVDIFISTSLISNKQHTIKGSVSPGISGQQLPDPPPLGRVPVPGGSVGAGLQDLHPQVLLGVVRPGEVLAHHEVVILAVHLVQDTLTCSNAMVSYIVLVVYRYR